MKELADSWGKDALFLPTFKMNEHYLKLPQEELPFAAGQIEDPRKWPPGRPQSGVSVVYAPGLSQDTAVHFSWKGGSCAIRNYTQAGLKTPSHPQYQGTFSTSSPSPSAFARGRAASANCFRNCSMQARGVWRISWKDPARQAGVDVASRTMGDKVRPIVNDYDLRVAPPQSIFKVPSLLGWGRQQALPGSCEV